MKLSVVVPCRNAAATIGVQLDALSRQCGDHDVEIVVVDNRSTDASAQVVAKYCEQIRTLRLVLAHEREGPAYARNCGVRASTGDAILFCDADDEVGAGWLAAMSEALRRRDFVGCRVDLTRLNRLAMFQNWQHPQSLGLQRMPYPPYLPHAGGGTLGVKRWLHDAVGGFDEAFRFIEDTHYCLKIQLAGHPLEFVPDAVVHVRVRDHLAQVFRQGRQWGQYSVRLYQTSRQSGTDRLPHALQLGWRAWRSLVRGVPAMLTKPTARRAWIFQLGYRTGRLLGTIRYRTMAP